MKVLVICTKRNKIQIFSDFENGNNQAIEMSVTDQKVEISTAIWRIRKLSVWKNSIIIILYNVV